METNPSSELQIEIRDRVKKGTEWLDDKRPNWEDEIDLVTFDMNSMEHCVLGQVFPGWDELTHSPANQSLGWLSERGFWLLEHFYHNGGASYGDLQKEWTRVIEERIGI